MAGIREVAKRAGVSIATVSRILNEDATISVLPETREKIMEAVEFFDYKLKKKQSKTQNIALITTVSELRELEDPYFRAIRQGIQIESEESSIHVKSIIRLSETQLDIEKLKGCQAVLIIGQVMPDVIEEILVHSNHLVAIDDSTISSDIDGIYTDLAQATRNHLDRLYAKGHRNIAYIGGKRVRINKKCEEVITDDEIRKITYEQWMKEKQLDQYIRTYSTGWTTTEGMEAMELLLAEVPELPTAIVAGSDPIAVGMYRALQQRGLKIPEDISVVGFDNIEIAEFLTPSLSTVNIDTVELGRLAVRMAADKLLKGRRSKIRMVLSNEIIVRESERSIN